MQLLNISYIHQFVGYFEPCQIGNPYCTIAGTLITALVLAHFARIACRDYLKYQEQLQTNSLLKKELLHLEGEIRIYKAQKQRAPYIGVIIPPLDPQKSLEEENQTLQDCVDQWKIKLAQHENKKLKTQLFAFEGGAINPFLDAPKKVGLQALKEEKEALQNRLATYTPRR